MKGFAKYAGYALAAAFVFLILGIVFLPFLFLIPFTLLSIVFYPIFRVMMPEFFEKRGF